MNKDNSQSIVNRVAVTNDLWKSDSSISMDSTLKVKTSSVLFFDDDISATLKNGIKWYIKYVATVLNSYQTL